MLFQSNAEIITKEVTTLSGLVVKDLVEVEIPHFPFATGPHMTLWSKGQMTSSWLPLSNKFTKFASPKPR